METSTSIEGAGPGAEVLEAPICQHQWMIDSPAGKFSRGACRLCGEQKDFQNYIEGSSWGYDVSLDQLSSANRLPGAASARAEKVLPED